MVCFFTKSKLDTSLLQEKYQTLPWVEFISLKRIELSIILILASLVITSFLNESGIRSFGLHLNCWHHIAGCRVPCSWAGCWCSAGRPTTTPSPLTPSSGRTSFPSHQRFGSGSAFDMALLDPDPYRECGSGSRSKEIDQNLQINLISRLTRKLFYLPITLPKVFFHVKSTVSDGKVGPGSGSDWIRILCNSVDPDPDSHWDKKLDRDPHWNQCGLRIHNTGSQLTEVDGTGLFHRLWWLIDRLSLCYKFALHLISLFCVCSVIFLPICTYILCRSYTPYGGVMLILAWLSLIL